MVDKSSPDIDAGASAPLHSLGVSRVLSSPLALEVARFGLPLALGMGLQSTFNLVDAYILAQLPGETASAALAAIGFCDQLAALGTILSYGLSIATGAVLSRKLGEGDLLGVEQAAWQSLMMIFALSLVFALLGIFGADAIMTWFGAKGMVRTLGTSYLRVMMAGSSTIFLLLHFTTIQRALGSSKTPIALLVAGNILNIIFAVLLVYGPGPSPAAFAPLGGIASALGIPRLEVVGAAWATVAARLLVLIPITFILVRRFRLFVGRSRVRPDYAMMGTIWRIGWPTSSQLVVRVLAILLVLAIVGQAYTTEEEHSVSTALGMVLRLETMALFVGLGWGSAAQTFMGQNLGANQRVRAKESGWYAALYNSMLMAAFWFACHHWGREFVGFFYDEPHVLASAEHYIQWVSPSYIALGIGIVLGSAIQGAGATAQTLKIDVLVVSLVQLPLCLAVWWLGLDVLWLWTAISFTYVCFAVTYVVSYSRGKFLTTRF